VTSGRMRGLGLAHEDERPLLDRYAVGREPIVTQETEMRVFGLALALALTAPIAAQAGSLEGKGGVARVGPSPAIIQIGDGGGSGWRHSVVGSWGPSGQFGASRMAPSNCGWCPPHWGPNRFGSGGPYRGPAVPTYWVWVPGSAVFDYPFSDWRGPTGGWGNP